MNRSTRRLMTILSTSLLTACASSPGPIEPATQDDAVLTQGLNHVGLTVSNLTASVDFFVNTLNWRKAGGYPNYPSVFVTDGNVFVTLWQTADPESFVAFDRKNNVGLHHLALTVTSFEALDALHERFLKTPGVVIEFAPELNSGGPTRHMMIREPSGNRLEFAHTPAQG